MKSNIEEGILEHQKLKDAISFQGRILSVPGALTDVRRDCIAKLLEATSSFLIAWGEHDGENVRRGSVRDALSMVFSEVGPGDGQVRGVLLETLSKIRNDECRQVVLDALPYSMPLDGSHGQEGVTDEVLASLRELLLNDASALLPILGCLSGLPLSASGRSEAWNVALASLPVVAEDDMPVLVQTLLRNVTTPDEAVRTLTALGAEMRLMEETRGRYGKHESLSLVAHVLLCALLSGRAGATLSQAYLGILRTSPESSVKDSFSVLDVLAMLAMYQQDGLKNDVTCTMDTMLEAGTFPFSSFYVLIGLLQPQDDSGSLLYNSLVPTLISVGIWLLLSPVRHGQVAGAVRSGVHELVHRLYGHVAPSEQEEIIRCLLHLSEESSWYAIETHRRRRGRRRCSIDKQMKGMQVTEQSVHHLILALVVSSREVVVKFKHILVERLTSSSSLSSNGGELRTIQNVCGVLSRLIDPGSHDARGLPASELMILVQKLLFASSMRSNGRASQTGEHGDVGRVVRGLVLAVELIKSSCLCFGDKECIYQWVQRILLPTTRQTIDPAVGRQGIAFLCTWHVCCEQAGVISGAERNRDSIFQTVKLIIANTGLVQMLKPYLQHRKKDAVLGYMNVPSLFAPNKKKRREMIFCVCSFRRFVDIPYPSRWADLGRWVFALVDKYLSLGRESASTGWAPDGWLEAGIELPRVFPSSTNSVKSGILQQWIDENLGSFEVSGHSDEIRDGTIKQAASFLVKEKELADVQKDIESILRLGISLHVAACLSAAVLRNTFKHYRSSSFAAHQRHSTVAMERKGPMRASEHRSKHVLKLMQYQMLKLFDLRKRALLTCRLFMALSKEFGKTFPRALELGRDDTKKETSRHDSSSEEDWGLPRPTGGSVDVQEGFPALLKSAADQLESAIEELYETTTFIDEDTAWACISDDHQDDRPIIGPLFASSEHDLQMAIHGETLNFLSVAFDSALLDSDSLGRHYLGAGIERCAQMAFRAATLLAQSRRGVSDVLQHAEVKIPGGRLASVLGSYFRLLSTVLCCTHESNGLDGVATVVSHCNRAVHSEQISSTLTAPDSNDQSSTNVFNRFNQCLRSCEDAVHALDIMDILCCLAWGDRRLALHRALDACWKVLLTVYSTTEADHSGWSGKARRLPFAFVQITRQMTNSGADRAILSTVVSSSERRNKEFTSCSGMRHLLLTLWGILMHPRLRDMNAVAYLSKLVDELESFLGSLVESSSRVTRAPLRKRKPRSSNTVKSGLFISCIPSLTASSFPVFFEILLNITVGSFAIFPHAILHEQHSDQGEGPFHHLQSVLLVFVRILEVYATRFKLFPRRMAGVVLNSCKHLLNLCLYHAEGAVQWRNTQPLLLVSERKAGKHDHAAIRYLDILLQHLTAAGAGKILSLCEFLRSQSGSSTNDSSVGDKVESDDYDIRGGDWLFGTHHSRFSALTFAAQRVVLAMKDIATTHNLVPPEINSSFVDVPIKVDGYAFRIEEKGFHDIGSVHDSSTDSSDADMPVQRKHLRRTPVLVHENFREDRPVRYSNSGYLDFNRDEDEEEWIDDDSNPGDLKNVFAASGEWGPGDDEYSETSCSSSDTQLVISGIVQAS